MSAALLPFPLLPNIAFPHNVVPAPAHSSESNVITQSGAAVEFEQDDMYLFKES
jgi:hypothetical protein